MYAKAGCRANVLLSRRSSINGASAANILKFMVSRHCALRTEKCPPRAECRNIHFLAAKGLVGPICSPIPPTLRSGKKMRVGSQEALSSSPFCVLTRTVRTVVCGRIFSCVCGGGTVRAGGLQNRKEGGPGSPVAFGPPSSNMQYLRLLQAVNQRKPFFRRLDVGL